MSETKLLVQVRRLHKDPIDFLNDSDLIRMLGAWSFFCKLTNMHTERLLASIKNSCPRNPTVERLVSAGLLTQVLRTHLGSGGADPRHAATSRDLVARGVPLASSLKAKQANPSKARGCFTYAESKIRKGLSRQERRTELSRLVNEFYSLTHEERAQYVLKETGQDDFECGLCDSASYSKDIGSKLWDMSSWPDMPISEADFIAAALFDSGVAPQEAGARRYIPEMRAKLRAGLGHLWE